MTDKILKWIFFLQCQLLLLLAYVTDGFEGGADAICHWMISRDAPIDPMLFLDQWNKPIFTLLSAPFAQFGLLGMRVFSALTGILTGLVLYRTAKNHLGDFAWLPAILLLFTPKYLTLLTSSMTEPLFGLFLAVFMLFVSKNKLGWAAIVAGLSPFVRQEGIALLPIAAAILFYVGQFRKTPLLFAGTVVFALIGWAVSGDVLWILTSFPYSSSSSDIYGSGELFHFLGYYKELFGIPISIIFLVGTLFLLQTAVVRLRERACITSFELAVLAGLSFSVFFFSSHSYIWWKGLSGSAGLIRVMACFAPAMALVGAYGSSRLLHVSFPRNSIANALFLVVFLIASAFQVISITEIPVPLAQTQVTMRQAAGWLIDKQAVEKVHYSDPVFSYFASGKLNLESPINKGPLYPWQINEIPVGEYIVWDANFSPNEGRLPLDSLMFHPFLAKRKSFHHKYSFLTQEKPYLVHIFQKTDTAVTKELGESVLVFENFENDNGEFELVEMLGRSNSKCAPSNKDNEYVTISKYLNTREVYNTVNFQIEVWIRTEDPLSSEDFFLVSECNLSADTRHYLGTPSSQISDFQPGEWNKMVQLFELPQNLIDSTELKCYIWNPKGIEILVDDFKLEATSLVSSLE